ncbi:MAG TPA: hypothetical protein VG204_21080 [Terriglobia bacterium]|nr:hypothetical protein [Terriglobia bacterium]
MPRLPLHKVLAWVASDKEKSGDSHQPSSDTVHFRRSSRIPHSITLSLSGQDDRGNAFEARGQTRDVNKHGAKVVTSQLLAPETAITLANLATGHTCLARVIWRAHPSRNGFETGIEVVEPADPELIWAVESSPSDWAEGCAAPTADERLEVLCQRARADRSVVESSAKTDDIPSAVSGSEAASPEMTAAIGAASSHMTVTSPLETATSVEALEPPAPPSERPKSASKPSRQSARIKPKVTLLALNLGQAPRVAAKASAPEVEQSAGEPAGVDSGMSQPESVPSAEVPVEGAHEAVSNNDYEVDNHAEEKSQILGGDAGVSSRQSGSTTGEVQLSASEEGGAGAAIRPPSVDTETLEKFAGALRASGDQVVNQVREQLAHMTFKSLEILTQKAKTLTEDCQGRLTKALDKTVSRSQDSVSSAIRRASEQAVTGLESSQQKIEAGFEARAAEYEKRLEERSSSAAEGLQQQADSMVVSFRDQLDNALADFQQRTEKRLQTLVDRLTAQFEQNWTEQAEKQTASMADKLSEKLRVAGSAVVGEAKNELASVTKTSLEAVTQATAKECHSQLDRIFREQSERVSGAADTATASIKLAAEQGQSQLRIVRQEMGGSFENSAHESEKRLAAQITRGAEALDHKSSTLLEEFEVRLGNSLRHVEEKAGKQLSAALEKVAVKKSEDAARQFELHAAEAERKLKEGLTASGESVVEEARRLGGITHNALESLTQTAAEECRRKLDEFRSQTGSVRRQMDELSKKSTTMRQVEAAPVRQPWRSRGSGFAATLVFLLALVPAGIAVYLSTRPVLRLRAEPPAGFVDSNPKWTAKRAASEDQLGRAYWDVAVQNIQPMYHYGTSLPVSPPVAFQVDAETLAASGVKGDSAAARTRYWQKLRDLWDQPATWEQSYGWNTDWINNLTSNSDTAATKANRARDAGAQAPADANP